MKIIYESVRRKYFSKTIMYNKTLNHKNILLILKYIEKKYKEHGIKSFMKSYPFTPIEAKNTFKWFQIYSCAFSQKQQKIKWKKGQKIRKQFHTFLNFS